MKKKTKKIDKDLYRDVLIFITETQEDGATTEDVAKHFKISEKKAQEIIDSFIAVGFLIDEEGLKKEKENMRYFT